MNVLENGWIRFGGAARTKASGGAKLLVVAA